MVPRSPCTRVTVLCKGFMISFEGFNYLDRYEEVPCLKIGQNYYMAHFKSDLTICYIIC